MQDLLVTAGADASIKLWHLADWLPGSSSQVLSLPPLPPPHDVGGPFKPAPMLGAAAQHANLTRNVLSTAASSSAEPSLQPPQAQHAQQQQHSNGDLPEDVDSNMPESQHAQHADKGAAPAESAQQAVLPQSKPSPAYMPHSSDGAIASARPQPISGTVPGGSMLPQADAEQLAASLVPVEAAAQLSSKSSKSEWVRCMKLQDESCLYMATNQGRLYSMDLSLRLRTDAATWRDVYNNPSQAAIICMEVLHTQRSQVQAGQHQEGQAQQAQQEQAQPAQYQQAQQEQADGAQQAQQEQAQQAQQEQANGAQQAQQAQHDSLILGDMSGSVTIVQGPSLVQVTSQPHEAPKWSPAVSTQFKAFEGQPVLAVFAPRALAPGHVITVSVSGCAMRWWYLPTCASSSSPHLPTASGVDASHAQAAATAVASGGSRGKNSSSLSIAHDHGASDSSRSISGGNDCDGGGSSRADVGPAETQLQQQTTDLATRSAVLLAELQSVGGKGSQIVALDVCPDRGVLICGDMTGRVMAYHCPNSLLASKVTGNVHFTMPHDSQSTF